MNNTASQKASVKTMMAAWSAFIVLTLLGLFFILKTQITFQWKFLETYLFFAICYGLSGWISLTRRLPFWSRRTNENRHDEESHLKSGWILVVVIVTVMACVRFVLCVFL